MKIKHFAFVLLCFAGVVVADSPKQRDYHEPDMRSFIALEKGFEQLFKSDEPQGLSSFYKVKNKGSRIWLETDEQLGWGRAYFSAKVANPWFLQVPHRYHDKWTWDIANHWRKLGVFKLVMANTVHRYAGHNRDQPFNADWSVASRNPMLASSRAFITSFEKTKIFQLHGFNQAKRKDERAQSADVILSHGTKAGSQGLGELKTLAECIKQQLDVNVVIYPIEVSELGGTKNLIAKTLRHRGRYKAFVHIELAFGLRQLLVEDESKSQLLLQCISGGAL